MNDDYIIAFDENGDLYIAHSERRQHKYLKKIPNGLGSGKDLYLYTQKEIDAWEKRGKRTFSNKLKDAIGYDERDRLIDAKQQYDLYGPGKPAQYLRVAERQNDKPGRPYKLEVYNTYENEHELTRAREAYKKTILSKIDKATEVLSKKLSELIY